MIEAEITVQKSPKTGKVQKPTKEEKVYLDMDTALTLEKVREYLSTKTQETERMKRQDEADTD